MNIGFISFAGGDFLWKLATKRISRQAADAQVFSAIKIYTPQELKKIATASDYNFISSHKRGYGYWLWKPILVLEFLNTHPEVDAILYADAGCDLAFNVKSRKTWSRYLGHLESHGGIAFKMELIEDSWTKQEVFDQFPEFEEFRKSEQLLAGVFIMNRQFALDFSLRWLKAMRTSNYSLLDDCFNESIQNPDFKKHRHDQSLFSLMTKQDGRVMILDSFVEVYFEPNWNRGIDFPIWTSRNKSYVPRYDVGRLGRTIRVLERVLKRFLAFSPPNN